MNSFGQIFRLTTFGESHGPAIGGVIDGMPAGIKVDFDLLQSELNRRRPGQSALTTSRKESDQVELLSGVFEGLTTGCPIGFLVRNENQHSSDYDNLRNVFRPSHADYTYQLKYGVRDHRGGGRTSARETISRVVGGAFAKMLLSKSGIRISAYTSQVGPVALKGTYKDYDLGQTEQNPVRCPDPEKADEMARLIAEVKAQGDTIGGIITGVILADWKISRVSSEGLSVRIELPKPTVTTQVAVRLLPSVVRQVIVATPTAAPRTLIEPSELVL